VRARSSSALATSGSGGHAPARGWTPSPPFGSVPARGAAAASASAATQIGVGAGFAALRRDRTLALLAPAVVVLAVLEAGWASVLAPVYGREVLGSALVLGVLFGALGAGATAGSLLHPWRGTRLPAHRLLVAAVLLAGAPRFAVLAAAPPLGWLLLAVLVAGLAVGVLGPLWLGVQDERVRWTSRATCSA